MLLFFIFSMCLNSWTIWPQPSSVSIDDSSMLQVVPGKEFFNCAEGKEVKTLQNAFGRYATLTFPHSTDSDRQQTNLPVDVVTISIQDLSEAHPQLETDETYQLTVSDTKCTLSAQTIYGAMRGLETLSQLIIFDFDTQNYIMPASVSIDDKPRFPHRGLMVDCSRHWQSLQSLRNIIDTLPYAKLNVLHIHMSDSQSFPYEVKTSPKLWEGSYSKFERYTVADMKEIVEFGRERGVRVIVEFDMPGHASSWCSGYPEVCPSPTCTQPLNVAADATWNLIENLINETQSTFVDNMMHLGGDEVNTDCWDKTPSIKKWLDDRNMTAHDGYSYFVKKTGDLVSKTGRRPIQWSEVFEQFRYKTSKNIIVHVWKSQTNLTDILAGGYNALVNVGYWNHSWYLDNLKTNWTAIYDYDLCEGQIDEHCKLIYGGHGEMWGETVDGSDLQQTVWPRLAAIAERLWSPRNMNNLQDALPRIEEFRCRLLDRGVDVAPVQNSEARSSPSGPGSCAAQRRRRMN